MAKAPKGCKDVLRGCEGAHYKLGGDSMWAYSAYDYITCGYAKYGWVFLCPSCATLAGLLW